MWEGTRTQACSDPPDAHATVRQDVPISSIYSLVKKYKQYGYVGDQPKPGGALRAKITDEHRTIINEILNEDSTRMAPFLLGVLQDRTGLDVTLDTVRR